MAIGAPPGQTGPTQLVQIDKGDPFVAQDTAQVHPDTTQNPLDTTGFNSVLVDMIQGPGAGATSVTVLGAAFRGGPWVQEVDPQAFQSGVTVTRRFLVVNVSLWVAVALTAPAGWRVVLTPINAASTTNVTVTGTSNTNVAQVGGVAVGPANPLPVAQQGTANTNVGQVGGVTVTLGQKASASSFPVVLASDNTITVQSLHPAATTGTFTTASTAGTSVVGPVSMINLGSAIVTVRGVYGAGLNLAFEADDGSGTWYAVQAVRSDSFVVETTSGALAANQSRAWEIDLAGFTNFRVRDLANPASGTATVTIIPTAESADPAVAVTTFAVGTITGTSPATATTAAIGAALLNLGQYRSLHLEITATGATGGTLDLYLQVSYDNGTTWWDYAHLPQLAAGAAAVRYAINVSRAAQSGAAPLVVGTALTPALAANTVVGGDFGQAIRLIGVGGAGTTAGATQTINVFEGG
jgi:hypothetical protein